MPYSLLWDCSTAIAPAHAAVRGGDDQATPVSVTVQGALFKKKDIHRH